MNIGFLQQHNTDDRLKNIERLCDGVRDLARRGAELVVLQELHHTLYFCDREEVSRFDLAETIPGPSTDIYGRLARETGVVLVTSLFEKRATGLYHNTAVVFEKDGTIAGKYRKMHIPDDPGYYEKFYFTPGDLGFQPIQTSVGRLGVLVCWDQWYPEAARLMALQGADLLIYPTAIGYDPNDTPEEQQRQRQAWQLVMRGHAVANGLPVVAVNRVGSEELRMKNEELRMKNEELGMKNEELRMKNDELRMKNEELGMKNEELRMKNEELGMKNEELRMKNEEFATAALFWGSSFVCGPQGELYYEASEDEEESIIVSIDMSRSEQVRRWWPFLRDRRIDCYQDLTKRFIDNRQ